MTSHNTNSTPHKAAVAGYQQHRQVLADAATLQKEYGKDMAGNWVGPFTIPKFFGLMPIAEEDLARMPQDVEFPDQDSDDSVDAKREKHLYKVFEKTIREYGLSPNFDFFIAADGKSKGGDIAYRPDGGFHELSSMLVPTHNYNTRAKAQRLAANLHGMADAAKDGKKPSPVDERKAFNWSQDGLVVEFKKSSSLDPFTSSSDIKKAASKRKGKEKSKPVSFPKLTDEALRIRGQLSIYATYAFAYQHRTHLFQLLICGRTARFLFWDHSGAIVSDSFDYVDEPLTLAEFLWRYNHMTPADRGWDATVQLANATEQKDFVDAVKVLLKNMKDPKHPQYNLPHAARTLDDHHPIFKISVTDDVSGESTFVIVQRPFFRSHSALGRATRGYIAYHLTRRELLFLKDTWRVVHSRLIPEYTLCRQMVEAGVPFVPKVIAGGDVLCNGQRGKTRCDQWAESQTLPVGVTKPRIFHQHRILSKLAYPVTSAPNSAIMVKAFRDCIEAMLNAKELCDLVHRDISIGNVMLCGDGTREGILADWDHAGKISVPPGTIRQHFRTGTWQFMSIALLQKPDKLHDIMDDFEAIFWSLFHASLHRFDHTNINLHMEMFDEKIESTRPSDGAPIHIGGELKKNAIRDLAERVAFTCLPLNSLIQKMAKEFDEYYTMEIAARKAQQPSATPNIDAENEVDVPRVQTAEDDEDDGEESSTVEDVPVALKMLNEQRAKLSDPKFWLKMFNNSLKQGGWKNDALANDPYAPRTVKAADQEYQQAIHSSLQDSSALRSLGVAAQDPIDLAEVALKQAEVQQQAATSDESDNGESHTSEDLAPMELGFAQPSSRPSLHRTSGSRSTKLSRTAAKIASLPRPIVLVNPPKFLGTSRTTFSDYAGSSGGFKRSIDAISDDAESSGEQDAALSPPPKKSRSRASAKAVVAPTDRKTRSSSRKASDTAQEATKTVRRSSRSAKDAPSLRKTRSGDVSTASSQPKLKHNGEGSTRPRTRSTTRQ